jgi:hypothetical protein
MASIAGASLATRIPWGITKEWHTLLTTCSPICTADASRCQHSMVCWLIQTKPLTPNMYAGGQACSMGVLLIRQAGLLCISFAIAMLRSHPILGTYVSHSVACVAGPSLAMQVRRASLRIGPCCWPIPTPQLLLGLNVATMLAPTCSNHTVVISIYYCFPYQ